MEVILTKDVENLGQQGDMVMVQQGYAMNFLFPLKMAIVATPGAKKDLEGRIAKIKAKLEKKHQEDLAHAKTLENLGTLSIEAMAGDEGKLFGTITTKELNKILLDKSGLTIDRRNLILDKPISRVGEYSLLVKFSSRVSARLPISVIAAEDE